MTLAFTFKIKDAWVIVADKKAVSKFKAESQSDLSVFSDSIEKIKEINKNLFFMGDGDKDVLDLLIDNSKTCLNFEEFKINLDNQSFIQREEFLVIEKNTQKGFKIKKDFLGQFQIKEINNSVNDNNFIGCYAGINLGNVKEELKEIAVLEFEEIGDKFYNFCNRCLSFLSVDYLNEVGHPLIHGSDIWIISREKIKKISANPKREYSYTEEVKEDD
jgi:hypothetical protein